MGLNTSHGCWDGPYSSFRDFRELVGRAAGLPYRLITDPSAYDYGKWTADIDWSIYPAAAYQGHWYKVQPTWVRNGDIYSHPKQDDVLYLIVHSDCDGKLRRGYLPRLKARLEELEPRYDQLAAGGYGEKSLRRFIEGLERAIEAGEHVDFH